MIQRGGQVVIKMLPDVKQQTIKPVIVETIIPGTQVMTDEYDIYNRLRRRRAAPGGGRNLRRDVIGVSSCLTAGLLYVIIC